MPEMVVNINSLVAAAVDALEARNGAGGNGGVGNREEINILIESPGTSFRSTETDGMVLCKICHDEGSESEMETPCACDGSIKFAHRNCVQKWIDQKGDINCEICHKEYRPGYTVHPKSGDNGWFGNAITEYGEIINRGVGFLNTAGIVMMVLLIFRYILMLFVDVGGISGSSWYINKYIEFAGILFPGFAFIRALFLVRWREWFCALIRWFCGWLSCCWFVSDIHRF